MKTARLLLLLAFVSAQGYAQKNCIPANAIQINANDLNESSLINILSRDLSPQKMAKKEDIDKLKNDVSACKNTVKNDVNKKLDELTSLSSSYQNLLGYRDLKEKELDLLAKRKIRVETLAQINTDLSNFGYQGLYVCLLNNINPLDGKEKLALKAKSSITPLAISTGLGTFVNSYTVVVDYQPVEDYIKTQVAGEMKVDDVFLQKAYNSSYKFIYIAKVQVLPLQKDIAGGTNSTIASANSDIIMDLLDSPNWRTTLSSAGIATTDLDFIEQNLDTWQSSIRSYNLYNQTAESKVLREAETRLKDIDEQIKKLEDEINNIKLRVKKIMAEKTPEVIFDSNNVVGSIDKALLAVKNKLLKEVKEITTIREQDLFTTYERSISAEGEPNKNIAQGIIDIISQMKKDYEKIDQYKQVTEVENLSVSNYSEDKSTQIKRNFETAYIVVRGDDDDNFRLSIICKFKIVDADNKDVVPDTSEIHDPPKPDPVVDNSNIPLFPICNYSTGNWGYIDANGKVIIGFDYKIARKFYDGYSITTGNDGYSHTISKKNKELSVADGWDDCNTRFTEGLLGIKRKDKWGFINTSGKLVIDCIFDGIGYFSDGYCAVKKSDKWGYINKQGTVIIDYVYNDCTRFFNGLAAVKKGDKWGYVNTQGKEVIPFIYDDACQFKDGYAQVKKDGKWGFINTSGKKTTSLKYLSSAWFRDGSASVQNKKGKWGYINTGGHKLRKFKYEDAWPFSNGIAAVKKDGKWGFINKKDKKIIDFIYDDAEAFRDGLAHVNKNGKWGYVDSKGKEIFFY